MAETSKARDYFKKCFSKNLLIKKAIIAAAAAILVISLSLSFYLWLKDKPDGTIIGQNGFWYINVDWNEGIGFSGLSGKTAAIFVIQTFMFLLLLTMYLLLTHDSVSCTFVALAMFGGLFNLFQRAADFHAVKSVLDYFTFGPWIKFPFIFNWPDMFVVIGIFGFVISYIVVTIIQAKSESHAKKEQNGQ